MKKSTAESKEYSKGLERIIEERTAQLAQKVEQLDRQRIATLNIAEDLDEVNKSLNAEIAERKKIEKALRESEKRYRYLFEQSPLGIGLATPDGKVVRANRTMEIITGYFEEELKKINPADTYENPEDRNKLLKTIDRYGCAVDFPVRLKRKDGTVYDALLNVSRVHLEGQDLLQTICMDITERKKAEEEVRSLAKFPAENPNPVLRIARDGTILYANDASSPVLQTWGCEKGQRIPDSCHKRVEEALGSGKVCTFEFECYDGHIFLVALAPVVDGDYVNAYGIDITERKRAEEALRESEKLAAKGQLAAQIAHEINNPLAGIKNSFLLIKDAVPESHPYYRYVGLIEKEISRMSRVVHGMFELYRPDSEEPREFSLDETVREVVELLGSSYRRRNVLIGIGGRSAVVRLPESSLRQVLYNIVKNAIEASPAGGEVEISTKVTDDALTISVRDQGEGISEQARPHIFEPLFTTKRGVAGAGLGLGLSTSKNIVESMGGSVYFESKAGEGTVFSIIIPLGK